MSGVDWIVYGKAQKTYEWRVAISLSYILGGFVWMPLFCIGIACTVWAVFSRPDAYEFED